MKLASFFCIFLWSTNIFAIIDPFSKANYLQNIQNGLAMARQLREAKEQVSKMAENIRVAKNQLEQGRKNLKGLDLKKLSALKNSLKEMRKKVKGVHNLHKQLADLDKDYNTNFVAPGGQLSPSEEDNLRTEQQIKKTLAANQKSIDSLSVLETYATDVDQVNEVLNNSNSASGAIQAAQSTNQMLALMAKNEQEMKLVLARDLEQRTLAMSQEQLNKNVSWHEGKRFFNDQNRKVKSRRLKKLPDLKKERR